MPFIYRIWSKTGSDFGPWTGETKAEALCAMHRAMHHDVRLVDGQLEFHDAEQRDLCGDVDDWIFEQVTCSDEMLAWAFSLGVKHPFDVALAWLDEGFDAKTARQAYQAGIHSPVLAKSFVEFIRNGR